MRFQRLIGASVTLGCVISSAEAAPEACCIANGSCVVVEPTGFPAPNCRDNYMGWSMGTATCGPCEIGLYVLATPNPTGGGSISTPCGTCFAQSSGCSYITGYGPTTGGFHALSGLGMNAGAGSRGCADFRES